MMGVNVKSVRMVFASVCCFLVPWLVGEMLDYLVRVKLFRFEYFGCMSSRFVYG